MLKSLEVDNLQPNDRPIFPYNTSDTLKVEVIVVEGDGEALLSYATSMKLELIEIKCRNVQQISNIKRLEQRYPEVFNGVGNLKDCEIKLRIDNNITPVAQTNRRIPFHFRKKVEDELNRLEKEGIIEKVTGLTSWISPTVIVPKSQDLTAIRLCVDMRPANKAICRVRNVMPTTDDIITQLNGAK
ncbi:hypothetical protein Trydic_g18608, partial [Trypoxylus dichotomus]